MRQSIGGLWIMSIMIVFIAIFIAFVSIQMNYSEAFRLKSDMVTVIEEYQGINQTTLEKINILMDKYGYTSKGACKINSVDDSVWGVNAESADGKTPYTIEKVNIKKNKKYNYCLKREKRDKTSQSVEKYYYDVQVFFGFSLPGFGQLYTFRVGGETNAINYPNDKLLAK